MIGILVALKALFEMPLVLTVLTTLDTGLNVAALFGIIKSKFSTNSIEYEMVSAIEEAFESACGELGWAYDTMAVSDVFDLKNTKGIVMEKDSLTKLLNMLTGFQNSSKEVDIFIDCFDKAVSKRDALYRYIIQKWVRYFADEKSINNSYNMKCVPIAISTIPADVRLIGRKEDIRIINEYLDQHGLVLIKADGGVGKTAVALRIANDIKREICNGSSQFKHIAWITSSGDLKNDLIKLDIPIISDHTNPDDKLSSIIVFLQNNPVLMVIDNMDDLPTSEEKSILNTILGRTKLILTSRVDIKGFPIYSLPEVDNESAERLFYRHYTEKDLPFDEIKRRDDYGVVQNITKSASNNALLIELLGKMAFAESKNLLEFISLLEGSVFSMKSEASLQTPHAESHGQINENDDKLTMQEQIRRLYLMSGLTPNQMEILSFTALFPNGSKIFSKLFEWCGFSVNDIQWLLRRGWITKEVECYSMHPIVKGSIELQNEKSGFEVKLSEYKYMINELIDTRQYLPDDLEFDSYKERVAVPKWICQVLEKEELSDNDALQLAIHLMLSVSEVYRSREGDYKNSLVYCFKALNGAIRIYGDNTMPIAGIYNRIAMIYLDSFDYESALLYIKKDYMISLKTNESDFGMACTYNLLGEIYGKLKKYSVSKYYFLRALSLLSSNSGDSIEGNGYIITKAQVFDNIGNMFNDWGKYEKALTYHLEALSIYKSIIHAEVVDMATTYNNIALTYYNLGMLDEAQCYYEKSLSIRTKVIGDNHPFLIGTYLGLIKVYIAQGNEKALQRTKVVLKEKYGLVI